MCVHRHTRHSPHAHTSCISLSYTVGRQSIIHVGQEKLFYIFLLICEINTHPVSLSFPVTRLQTHTHSHSLSLHIHSLSWMLVLHKLPDRFPDSWKGDKDQFQREQGNIMNVNSAVLCNGQHLFKMSPSFSCSAVISVLVWCQ